MGTSENPWKIFFDQHAPNYMNEVFTRNTEEEIRFLIEEFSLPAGSHILDVGCGTGRHAIELAKNGYRVTGVDISSGMLAEAEKAAAESGVKIDWIESDAAVMELNTQADAVICLCEGSFGLIGSADEAMTHEQRILESIHRSAKPGAKLVLTAPNGLAKIRAANEEQIRSGEFDPLTLTESFTMQIDSPHGQQELRVYERGFVPSELRLLLELTGFGVHEILGGTAGSWNREMVALDEIEIMVIAERR